MCALRIPFVVYPPFTPSARLLVVSIPFPTSQHILQSQWSSLPIVIALLILEAALYTMSNAMLDSLGPTKPHFPSLARPPNSPPSLVIDRRNLAREQPPETLIAHDIPYSDEILLVLDVNRCHLLGHPHGRWSRELREPRLQRRPRSCVFAIFLTAVAVGLE